MQLGDWERYALFFSITCHFVLLWRLWSEKLVRTYLFLAVYLAAEAVNDIVLIPVDPTSLRYVYIFVISSPVLWLLSYLVILELYRLVLEDYPGIASAGRKAVSWALGLAVIIAVVYAIPDLRAIRGPSTTVRVVRVYFVLERSIALGILVLLVLLQLFLLRYRLRLSPNRIVYATGYAVYFAVTMAQDVIATALGIKAVYGLSLWTFVAASASLLVGAALLSQRGEVRPQLDTADTSAERARLQQELADINRMLSRAARSRG